jgi:hypothetical protein
MPSMSDNVVFLRANSEVWTHVLSGAPSPPSELLKIAALQFPTLILAGCMPAGIPFVL